MIIIIIFTGTLINIVIRIARHVLEHRIVNVILVIVHIINGRKEVYAKATAELENMLVHITANMSSRHQQELVAFVILTADFV